MGHRARRVEARDEQEVVRAVEQARASDARLRPGGAGGSKSGVNTRPEVELRLRQPDRLLEVDGRRVTAPAGMTTGRLHALLRPHGLVVPTVGEWKTATLAGSLATGTHGGSARHGVVSTSLRSLRLVTGRGDVVDLERGDEDFEHAGVSLGALGVLTRVTLACEERFDLELETDVVPFGAYRADPVAHESRTEFHASIWVPWADRVVRFGADRVSAPAGSAGIEPQPREQRFGTRTAAATFLARRLGLTAAVSDRVFRRTAVGDCADVLSPLEVSSRKARFRNAANAVRGREAAELAVPAARAAEALERFDAFFDRRSSALNNPIGLRVTPADGFSLSPSSGRDTLWMDLFYDDDERFVAGLRELAVELDARCHWGKALVVPPEVLRRRYPRWDAFREARARLDPDEVFANRFTDALGLTGGGGP